MFDPDGPVLGIDPGLSRCGYGAVRRSAGAEPVAVAYGVLRTDPDGPLAERLAALEADLETLVADVGPSALAVERILFQANVRTAISVGQASGLALVVAARARVPVTHYSPNEVKLAVTGSGTADKAQVQEMVARLLHLATPPSPPDAADALALALCHGWSAPLRAAVGDTPAQDVDAGPGLARAVTAALAREDAT
ncbi:MAG: crossover junction endodeoxyribonuclease RuvC [Acidimicrobiia bacterium]|nr:crossover junction endodeoxyribonuclease RuvC [Acidimicrobiia bacterium]